MLSTNTYDAEKLQQLRALARLQLCEVVAVYLPGDVRYFGAAAYHELPNFRAINRDGVPITVEPRLIGRALNDVHLSADVSDDRVALNFIDHDGAITEFLGDAEGAKVELFYYLPDLDWFVSHWWGHLQLPDAVDLTAFNASAECGIRSSQMSIPRTTFQQPCQNNFGGVFTTQAEVDAGRCPYNRQLAGGTVGNLDGDAPFSSCPKTKAACIARLADTLSYTGFDTAVINLTIGQSQGPATQAVSRGNETNLARPLRRIYGRRVVRDLDLGAMRQEHNTGHPDQGFLAALFWVCAGRIRSMSNCSVVNMLVGAEHLNIRLGARRQPPTAYAPNVLNFNSTAHFFGRVGPLNPGGYGPQNVFGSCTVEGADDVRVYTNDGDFSEQYTTNPWWCFLDLYRDPFFGHGVDPSIMVMQDWIDGAAHSDETVAFTDPFGTVWTSTRDTFNADVQGRSAQTQFRDLCLWHRIVPPFQYLGKLRTFPLRPFTPEELGIVPVFRDDTPQRNIVREHGKPLISWERMSDRNLPNQLQVTFEETNPAQNINNVERPLTFGDEVQQLRAGRAFGDTTLRVVPQQHQAFGIIHLPEVVRKANLILDTGEFEQGGLRNNFRVRFTCTFNHGFELYPYQVIRVESALIARASAGLQPGGFKYFRVLGKTRRNDLSYEVVAQAYPELYWASVETVTGGGPVGTNGYEAEDEANTLEGTAAIEADEDCSNDAKVTGLGDMASLTFNGIEGGDTGTHRVTIFYKSPEPRDFRIRANNSAAQLVHGFATGETPRAAFVVLDLAEGGENTITIFNPPGGGLAPDLDRIVVTPIDIDPGGGGPCRPAFGDVRFEDGRLVVPIEPC